MPKRVHIAGQIANRSEMAGILGISPTTLDRYVQAGCPFLEKGSGRREYRFNTAEVIRWFWRVRRARAGHRLMTLVAVTTRPQRS